MNNDLILIQDKINTHKSDLAANLAAKSVNANSSETLAVLIGKVKDIEQTGGGGSGGSGLDWSTVTSMSYAFYNSSNIFAFLWPTVPDDMSQVTSWAYAFSNTITSNNANEVFQSRSFKFDKLSDHMFYQSTSLKGIEFADTLTAYNNNASYCFNSCNFLPFMTALEALKRLDKTNSVDISSMLNSVSSNSETGGSIDVGDLEINASNMQQTFNGVRCIKSVGNITNSCNTAINMTALFQNCNYMQEIGLITTPALKSNTYNMFSSCNKLVKINGFSVPSQKYQGEIITSTSYRFISNSSLTSLEECLNIPVGYFRYGGTNIGLSGTASAVKPLKRLTFCQSDEGYYTKNYAKNLPIQYCSFDRDGMLEVFNTLPDASDVTVTSTITITGNPCVNDGTLTEEDIAIATAKGYVVTTA